MGRKLGLAGGVAMLALVGCTTGLDFADGPCLDDSKACVETRVGLVEAMAADQARGWIAAPVDRQTHQSGVRLFAYQRTKDALNCSELDAGIREMQVLKVALAPGPMPGVSAERNNQVKAMADDLRAQLTRLQKQRC